MTGGARRALARRLLLAGRPSRLPPAGEGPSQAVLGPPRTVRPSGTDVVLAFSFETWQTVCWREFSFTSDRLFLHLYSSPRVRRLILADAWQFAPARLARRLLGVTGDLPFPSGPATVHVEPTRLRRRDPTSPAAAHRAYRAYDARLAAAAARAGMRDPVLITTHPLHAAAADRRRWAGVTYLGRDDFAEYGARAPWRAALREAYRRISAAGIPVVGVTQAIVDAIAPTGPALVMPNGVDPDEWATPGRPPAWFDALPRPRLLYTGALGTRLDPDVLAALSRAHPQASIVLVGHAADPEHLAGLAELPGVHIRGRHSRADIRAMTFAAEVCLLPHVRTPLTRSMSPLKLFEYLAAGRPVVSTDLEPVRAVAAQAGGAVLLAGTPEEFAAQVGAALRRPPTPEADRLAFVAANSWHSRLEALLDFAGVGPAEDGALPPAVQQ